MRYADPRVRLVSDSDVNEVNCWVMKDRSSHNGDVLSKVRGRANKACSSLVRQLSRTNHIFRHLKRICRIRQIQHGYFPFRIALYTLTPPSMQFIQMLHLDFLPFLLFLPSKLAASFCTSSRASPALRLLDALFDLTLTVVLLPLRPPAF